MEYTSYLLENNNKSNFCITKQILVDKRTNSIKVQILHGSSMKEYVISLDSNLPLIIIALDLKNESLESSLTSWKHEIKS